MLFILSINLIKNYNIKIVNLEKIMLFSQRFCFWVTGVPMGVEGKNILKDILYEILMGNANKTH